MKLHEAFYVTPGDVVAFIGAGGKTSTLVTMAYELVEAGWRVLATTTTGIKAEQLELMPNALTPNAESTEISEALNKSGFVFLYDSIQNDTVYGPNPEWIRQLIDSVDSDVLLVEADVSNGMPLKAPYPDEPMIPPETSLVIMLASLKALSTPLDDEYIYNASAIIDRYGFKRGNTIKSPWIAQILRDETLGLHNVPKSTRVMAFLNQTPSKGYGRARARMIARLALRKSRLHGVAMGAARATDPIYEVRRPVGAVVLAAGMSSRMGEPKVLLPWARGKTIIEHIIEQLINARVEHIVVVTGHMAKEVKALVKPMGVSVVYNRSYRRGEMLSSLKVGLRAMPEHIAASLIVLGDQPRIQPKVIYRLLTAYSEDASEILAPSFEMRRGHPILLGRRFWKDIYNLPRTGSPRDMIDNHAERIHYVNVDTDSVLHDVDTPEDYTEERWRAGLT